MAGTFKIVNKQYLLTAVGGEHESKINILCTYYLSDGVSTRIVPYDMGTTWEAGNTPDPEALDSADADVLSTVNA